MASRGASEGEGARADLGVDTLVQGQVVSLLQVQEEEAVRDLARVKAFMLQPCLLDLESACGVAGGGGRWGLSGVPSSPHPPVPPGFCRRSPLAQEHFFPTVPAQLPLIPQVPALYPLLQGRPLGPPSSRPKQGRVCHTIGQGSAT